MHTSQDISAWTESDLDKIAIIGMANRFPESMDTQSYWNNLINGRHCINQQRTWHNEYTAKGGFLLDIDSFDANFFKISDHEAVCMDPQQRLLLETSWHAIQDAGITIDFLQSMHTGVFASHLPSDYKNLLFHDAKGSVSPHSFTGNAPSAISGRISYFYHLNGPSVTIDTACSSGLSAVNIARLSLLNNDCQVALVGAACLFSTSEFHQLASEAKMLSPSIRNAVFDESADGFVPSEGVAVLVLMKLRDAIAHNLHTYGLIENLKWNHNGSSNGIMAPNSLAQESIIRQTLTQSHIKTNEIALIEAHGTATKVGDLIELKALQSVFGQSTIPDKCYLGTSKAVIGHTLVCAGIASIIKVLLSYQNQKIPPNKHFKKPHSNSSTRLLINQEAEQWPKGKYYAGISAFGFTGSNAFLLLKFPKIFQKKAPLQQHTFAKKKYWITNYLLTQSLDQDIRTNSNIKSEETNLGLQRINNSFTKEQAWMSSINQGTPIILLPPLNTTYIAWYRQINLLQQHGYKLYIPEYPTHFPVDQQEFILQKIADNIIHYIENTNIQPHFIGWSLGGIISLLIAVKKPHLIRSLSLVSTSAFFDKDLFGKTIEMQKELQESQEYLSIVFNTKMEISKYISAKTSMQTLTQYYNALMSVQFSADELISIENRTLIIYGDQDPVLSEKQNQFLAQIKNSIVKSYKKCGHFIPIIDSHQFNHDVISFLGASK